MGTNDAGRTVLDAVCAVPRFLGQAVLMMCRRRLLGRVVDCFPSYTYAWGQPVRGLAPAKRASSPPASNARGWLGAPAERDLTTVTADLQPWLLPPHFITAHHPCRNTTTPPPPTAIVRACWIAQEPRTAAHNRCKTALAPAISSVTASIPQPLRVAAFV